MFMFSEDGDRYCRNTMEQNKIIDELLQDIKELRDAPPARQKTLAAELRKTRIGGLLEFSRAVHAEMDALLSAARKGVSPVAARLFVTTFPCHYCARHIVAAGVDEVQYIEPYPKSQALNLHQDSIAVEHSGWNAPSGKGDKVLFHPFTGVAPRLYRRAFMKDRELKDAATGKMRLHDPDWGTPWHLPGVSYIEIEAKLAQGVERAEEADAETQAGDRKGP
jgi:deoxycytidylate deaminase